MSADVSGTRWRAWLAPALILGPPFLAAAVSVGIAATPELESSLRFPFYWVVRANGLLAVAACCYGGLFARGPVGTRVAVAIATAVYGFAVYMVLMGIAQVLGVRFSF